jgi:hypothetical protein
MRKDKYDDVPSCLKRGTVLGAVQAWPGNDSARGESSATASLDSPCARRPISTARRDEGTAAWARTKELHR